MHHIRWFERVIKKYSGRLGPGLTAGAADDDPSGIATYSQAGAQFGFNLLWLAPLTFPLMVLVQEMCARIGIVTGKGLAANIRERFSAHVLMVLCTCLFVANTVNIAADLNAMAAAAQLIFPGVYLFVFICFFAVTITFLEIHLRYETYARILKYLTLALFSYVFAAFSVSISWGEVFHQSLIPHLSFSGESMFMICAILGTTISPYLFFWQSAQEVEEHMQHHQHTISPGRMRRLLSRMRFDVWAGMAFSNIIMFFIIVTCAATLYAHGITEITSAETAARALRPFAGEFAYLLFTLGIVATGFLAVPILAGSSAYAFAESYGWKHGLDMSFAEASSFYSVIIISMVLASLSALVGVDPIKLLLFAALLNGLIAPFIIFCIVKVSSALPHRRSTRFQSTVGYLLVAVMVLVGFLALTSFF